MSQLEKVIPIVRESVASILRVHSIQPSKIKKGREIPAKIRASIAGSAFCVVPDRYLITAYHVFNGGKTREEKDKFYAMMVPQNGDPAFHFPIIGFPIERPDLDLAVLELGPCATNGIHISAIAVTFKPQLDGSRVVTVGFPSPEIAGINVDQQLNYLGGQFFLKSHANEGIVSAQYIIGGIQVYELNVGWHHGESGGPIVSLSDHPAVFSLMQHYRNIQSPHGTVAGPHRGLSLAALKEELKPLGINEI